MHQPIYLDLPASDACLNVLDACIAEVLGQIEQLPEPGVTINDIRVSVQEAWHTIVQHAYGGKAGKRIRVKIMVDEANHCLTVELYDTGQPCTMVTCAALPPDPDRLNDHEVSLFLLRSLMDEVFYTSQPGRNCWRLVKHWWCDTSFG